MRGAIQVHGVAVALGLDPDGPLAGVLLLGAPGAGKSLLALWLIEACPYRRTALVADDIVLIEAQGARLVARAPATLKGLIEVRGFGPLPVRSVAVARLRLALDLGAAPARVSERSLYPADGPAHIPLLPFDSVAPASPARARAIARAILGGQT